MGKGGERILLIIDSNVLFSYFMLSQKTRNLILSPKVTLYTPDWTIHELNKYFGNKIAERAEKKGVSREELELIVLDVMRRLIIVPKALYLDKWDEALKIARQFDVKDTPFIALALKLNIPVWTNDSKMIEFGLKTGKYLAIDTQAVEGLFEGKSLSEVTDELRERFLRRGY